MVELVVVITMTRKNNNVTIPFFSSDKIEIHFKTTKNNKCSENVSHEISFFKIRQVEQFEASSSTDSTADVYHMVHWRNTWNGTLNVTTKYALTGM